MPPDPSPGLLLLDGNEALAAVHIIRRPDASGLPALALEYHSRGLGKLQAAYILRQVAKHWEAEEHAARVASGEEDGQ